ncbi:hypothetical protein H1D32_02915 [Anaerobacillus sp. CMMVII]|uniref:hypothetical protein n=1 Tax=Anaerobacillus sp. CMMVII TaxID=2755588 RepID=UPI0021B76476|nr:hypothetical protein [Anaerobacillus sp. CMMVII]MCT8136800.1 hypothetical protein [Anaerobacillus sp. CMMVII]
MDKKSIYIIGGIFILFYFMIFFKSPSEIPTDVRADIWDTSYEIMVEVLVDSSPYEPLNEDTYEAFNTFVDSYSAEATVNDPLTENEKEILYHIKGLVYHAQQFRTLYQECGDCFTDAANEQLNKMVEAEFELLRIYNINAVDFYEQ